MNSININDLFSKNPDSKGIIEKGFADKKNSSLDVKEITGTVTTKRVLSEKEPEIKCMLYDNSELESKHMADKKFTNFLPDFDCFDSYIEHGVKEIQNNPLVITKNKDNREADPVEYKGAFKERIKEIIAEYDTKGVLLQALDEGRIRKANIPTPLGVAGALRVVSLYEKDNSTNTTYFYILFIDFYHLFIPSKHTVGNGRNKREHTAEEMLDLNYKKREKCVRSFNDCYKDFLSNLP